MTHNSDNTCRLVLKALDQRDTYKVQLQDLEKQNDQKNSQIEELLDEKWGLKQDVLKMTRHLNNSEPEQSRENTLKLNASDTIKKCSAKFSDSPILNNGLKPTFQVRNDQMKSKL